MDNGQGFLLFCNLHFLYLCFVSWSARRPLWSYLEQLITTCLSLTLPWILSLSKINFLIKFLLIVIIAWWKIEQAFYRRIKCQPRRRSRVLPWNVTSLLQKKHFIAMQCNAIQWRPQEYISLHYSALQYRGAGGVHDQYSDKGSFLQNSKLLSGRHSTLRQTISLTFVTAIIIIIVVIIITIITIIMIKMIFIIISIIINFVSGRHSEREYLSHLSLPYHHHFQLHILIICCHHLHHFLILQKTTI